MNQRLDRSDLDTFVRLRPIENRSWVFIHRLLSRSRSAYERFLFSNDLHLLRDGSIDSKSELRAEFSRRSVTSRKCSTTETSYGSNCISATCKFENQRTIAQLETKNRSLRILIEQSQERRQLSIKMYDSELIHWNSLWNCCITSCYWKKPDKRSHRRMRPLSDPIRRIWVGLAVKIQPNPMRAIVLVIYVTVTKWRKDLVLLISRS